MHKHQIALHLASLSPSRGVADPSSVKTCPNQCCFAFYRLSGHFLSTSSPCKFHSPRLLSPFPWHSRPSQTPWRYSAHTSATISGPSHRRHRQLQRLHAWPLLTPPCLLPVLTSQSSRSHLNLTPSSPSTLASSSSSSCPHLTLFHEATSATNLLALTLPPFSCPNLTFFPLFLHPSPFPYHLSVLLTQARVTVITLCILSSAFSLISTFNIT